FVTSTSHGIWFSADDQTWTEYTALNYLRVQRLRWLADPITNEPSALLIGTFGNGAYQLDQSCFVVTDRSTFSKDEAQAHLAMPFRDSLYVVFHGFTPAELGFTSMAVPPGAFSVTFFDDTGMQVTDPAPSVDSASFET